MVRFVQSSDWQIGMKGSGLGEAGSIVREIRLDSIHNVFKAAQDHKVDFILLCGDLFEHNMVGQELVKKVITIFNEYPDIPIYLLPGNHDMLGPDSVYERPIFQGVENLTILRDKGPLEVSGAVLHPCPILTRFTTHDVTETIPDISNDEEIHVGIAHGSLQGKSPVPIWEDIDLPIDPSCVDRTGIDYLALGHWHGYRSYEDSHGVNRIAYSGTHEQTQYNEDNAGNCLLVQIKGKGDPPEIDPIQTGQLTWVSDEFEIIDESYIDELKNYLDSIKNIDMVRLVLNGELPLKYKEDLDNLLDFQSTLHKNFRAKLDSLNIRAPEDIEELYDFDDPTLNQTNECLRDLLSNEDDAVKKKIIVQALSHLQRFGKEAEL